MYLGFILSRCGTNLRATFRYTRAKSLFFQIGEFRFIANFLAYDVLF